MPRIGYCTYIIQEFPPEVYFESEENPCVIGKFCSIGSRLKVYCGGNHRIDWVSTYPFEIVVDKKEKIEGHPSSKGGVTIGNDVWIGNDVSIMSGSVIGDGCCIGAGSVVRGKFAPYTILIGNPAKHHRNRFSIETARRLQKLAWWDWDLDDIRKILPELHSNKVNAFFAKVKEMGKWNE